MTLKNRTPYRLKARNWVAPIEEVLEHFDAQAAAHRHFEMFPLTHSDYALTLAIDETDEPVNNPTPSPEEAAFGEAMAYWASVPPRDRQPLVDGLAQQIEATEAVDSSYEFSATSETAASTKWSTPYPRCGRGVPWEILRTIKEKEHVVFPLEYRYVKRDDTFSMSSGHEDHAAISIHRMASEDYRPILIL